MYKFIRTDPEESMNFANAFQYLILPRNICGRIYIAYPSICISNVLFMLLNFDLYGIMTPVILFVVFSLLNE